MSNTAGKTVAFLTSSLTIRLSRDIWSGIQEACHDAGINSVCFTGEMLYPEEQKNNQSGANIVYDLIDASNFDGIIIYTADIGELVKSDRMIELCKNYAGIPIVSIAWAIPDIPTIVIDNYTGMFSIVEHLVRDHGYQTVAFVQGPMDNHECVDRFNAYKDVLETYGIGFNEKLVCPGEFSRISGREAVHTLLKERKLPIEAIVCIDDETAVGVNEALQKMGLSVPEDIAITGFDNEAMSGVMTPPLSTVEQPLYREGHLALKTLIQIWNGEKPQEHFKTPTELVLRRSCGCSERTYEGLSEEDILMENCGSAETLHSVHSFMVRIVRDIAIDQELTLTHEEAEMLVASLIESHAKSSDQNFSTILWDILKNISNRGEVILPFQQILNRFHQIGLTVLTSTALIRFETILHRARVMIANVAERVNSFLRIDAVEKIIDLGDVNYVLNAHFTFDNIKEHFEDIADRNFNRLGIKTFYLALYKDSSSPLELSQLAFAWEEGVLKDETSQEYPTRELLPPKFRNELRKKHFTISPLFFNDNQYGYIIAETAPGDAMASDILSWQISGAFNRIDYIHRESERSEELQCSLDELKRTQKKLVEAEKMASLGNLVAGVAHEINTPVGASVTYASFFEEITDSIIEQMNSGKMTKTALTEFLEKSKEVSRGLMVNLNRTAELVQSFKEIAVDDTASEIQTFNLKSHLESILISMKNSITHSGHRVKLSCDKEIVLTCCPSHITSIVSHLLMNSLTHGFPDNQRGVLSLSAIQENTVINISYSDNGIGFSQEIQEQIFEPFFTTKRNTGGSGLGMHKVYNLVTQSLNGEIECESEEGKGVQFTITLPR